MAMPGLDSPETICEALAKDTEARVRQRAVGAPGRITRMCASFPATDLVAWLDAQKADEKVYWSDRDGGFAVAGIGAARIVAGDTVEEFDAHLESMRVLLARSDPGARFFGGARFDPGTPQGDRWGPFGGYRFVLPEVELSRQGDECVLAYNAIVADDEAETSAGDALRGLRFDLNGALNGPLPAVHRNDFPGEKDWCAAVERALGLCEAGQLEKIVLARETEFTFAERVNPFAVLRHLEAHTSFSYHYCFQIDSDHAIVGASPERLYRRDRGRLLSEALAGTRPRAKDPIADDALGAELLDSDKERREHDFVAENIRALFDRVCDSVDANGEPELLRLRHCQHMLTRIEGRLREDVGDADLLRRLHPTPAVGGVPTDEALKTIAELEDFDRGWYAGPVGWIGSESSEFAVAIRSGLVSANTVSVYTGAGIVPGSDPAEEWAEVESKIADFQSIFEGRAADASDG